MKGVHASEMEVWSLSPYCVRSKDHLWIRLITTFPSTTITMLWYIINLVGVAKHTNRQHSSTQTSSLILFYPSIRWDFGLTTNVIPMRTLYENIPSNFEDLKIVNTFWGRVLMVTRKQRVNFPFGLCFLIAQPEASVFFKSWFILPRLLQRYKFIYECDSSRLNCDCSTCLFLVKANSLLRVVTLVAASRAATDLQQGKKP